MPRRYTLGTLVTRCQQQCDLENHGAIGDAEWKAMISAQYAQLYALVSETGLRYFETSETFTSDGTGQIAEPDLHWSTVGVDYVDGSGRRTALRELMAQERNRYAGQTGTAVGYSLVDDILYLYPTPPSGQRYDWLYVAQSPDLSSEDVDDDYVVDVVTPDGESFLILGVAVRAKMKMGQDTFDVRRERDEARVMVLDWARMRALNQARTLVSDDLDPYLDPAERRSGWGW